VLVSHVNFFGNNCVKPRLARYRGPSLNKKNANNRLEEHWRFCKDEGQKLGRATPYILEYAALQRKSRLTLRKEI
jgi:hypothetical protein